MHLSPPVACGASAETSLLSALLISKPSPFIGLIATNDSTLPISQPNPRLIEVPMQIKVRLDSRPIQRWARLFSKQTLLRAARVMGPTLVALTFAGVAHAQGTMDFSGAQTLMGTFKTFAIYAGAVICFGGLIFAGIRMMSGRFQDAIPGLFGALFGAGVLGWGAGWIGSLPVSTKKVSPTLSLTRLCDLLRARFVDSLKAPVSISTRA